MAFLTGVFASMGLGGGMVLIVYLTVFAGFSQLAAQGINLVFFIPIAIISLVLHTKNKLVEWKKAVPAVLWGTAAVIISAWLANRLSAFRTQNRQLCGTRWFLLNAARFPA